MGLQIEISFDLGCIVQQNIVHGDIICPEMYGTHDQLHIGKELPHSLHDRLRIGIDRHAINFRDVTQGFKNMVEQRLPGQETVILARYPLAVVTHGNERANLHFIQPRAGKLIFHNVKKPGPADLQEKWMIGG
jgi:hypothetical protein